MPDSRVVHYESPIGRIEIEGSEAGVSALNFVESGSANAARPGKGPLPGPLADCLLQLDGYFRGKRTAFSVELDLRGTAFQKQVWDQLLRVKFGRTKTYKALAEAVGRPAATRAVGGGNPPKPLSSHIPLPPRPGLPAGPTPAIPSRSSSPATASSAATGA